MLEYTYQRDTVKMHGEVTMMRLSGKVFSLYTLTSDSAWPVDRDYFSAASGSFNLAR